MMVNARPTSTARRLLLVDDQTVRQIVHTSLGGDRVRVVLSNAFGTAPVDIGAAAVALKDKGSAVVAGSVKPLMFNGESTAVILPGAVLLSDPVDLRIGSLTDLAIDLYLPGELGIGPSPVTTHNGASQTNFISAQGNHVGEPALKPESQTVSWLLLARVEVAAPAAAHAVAAFGDSITDGARSTVDTNNRWPDELARRLAARKARTSPSLTRASAATKCSPTPPASARSHASTATWSCKRASRT